MSPSGPSTPRLGAPHRARSIAVLLVALGAAAAVLARVIDQSPIANWLAWHVGIILFWQAVLNLAWLSAGTAICRRLLPTGLPRLERLCISVATGVTAFYLALYGVAALGILERSSALAIAALFLVPGWPALLRWLQRPRQERRALLDWRGLRGLPLAATIAGALGVSLLYLGAFSPVAVNYDATWVHLTIAESYAREGRLLPFSGDWTRCYPYLASVLHAWDFLMPGLDHLATRCMMALHTEVALVLWTLVGIAAAINWMARATAPVRGAWAVFLLFPGLFVYDANIGGAADHVLGFFGPPLFLLSVRAPAIRRTGAFVLWGALAGAAIMTKYQAAYFVGPLGLLLCLGVAWRVWREDRPWSRATVLRLVPLAGTLVLAFVVVTAPHFLKNAVFHANPVYPLLQDWFPDSTPTVRDATQYVEHILVDHASRAPTEPVRRIKEALKLTFTFAFEPHYSFLGQRPNFGFGFTLALPLLLVVPRRKRLLAGCFASLAALFLWGFTYRVDRNLQTFMPLLAAATGALLVRAWEVGRLAKAGVAALVISHLVWGADLFFEGQGRYLAAFWLFNSEREGNAATRFDQFFADHVAIERTLPADAVLLLHHSHQQLGLNRPTYLDMVGFQGVIDYREFVEPRQLHHRLQELGVTHVVHLPGNQGANTMQEEAIFDVFLAGVTQPKFRAGTLEVFPLPPEPPAPRAPLQALLVGVGGYASGVYSVSALDANTAFPGDMQRYAPPRLPAATEQLASLADSVDVVMLGGGFKPEDAFTTTLSARFTIAASYPGLVVYVRNAPPGR